MASSVWTVLTSSVLSFPLSLLYLFKRVFLFYFIYLHWVFAVFFFCTMTIKTKDIYSFISQSFKPHTFTLPVSKAILCNRNKKCKWNSKPYQNIIIVAGLDQCPVSVCFSVCHLHIVLQQSGPESFGMKKPSWGGVAASSVWETAVC